MKCVVTDEDCVRALTAYDTLRWTQNDCIPMGIDRMRTALEAFVQTLVDTNYPEGSKLGEPVAWRYRHPDEPNGWCVVLSKARSSALASIGLVVEPLYAAPRHPTTEKGCE